MTLRNGFTTGSAAACAAKSAALSLLTGAVPNSIDLTLPNGEKLVVKTNTPEISQNINLPKNSNIYACASVIKDSGDDPDVTKGIEIIAALSQCSQTQDVTIKGGAGVGMITRPGLQISPGEHAINPIPREMIRNAVREIIPEGGVNVEIIVPQGEEVAKKTFNSRLGIEGGISILGTTGIVVPMSLDAIKATIKCEIDVAFEENKRTKERLLFMAPGKIGEKALQSIEGDVTVVQTSNFSGFAMDYAAQKGFRNIVFGGHPGKLAKIVMGYRNTHSAKSPPATNYVANFLGIPGSYNTVEEIMQEHFKGNLKTKQTFTRLAEHIAQKIATDYNFNSVTVYLFSMEKRLIGKGSICFSRL